MLVLEVAVPEILAFYRPPKAGPNVGGYLGRISPGGSFHGPPETAQQLILVWAGRRVTPLACRPLIHLAGVFDPDLLLPIIAELAGELQPSATDPRLQDVHPLLTAVDSTLVKTLPRLAEAMWSRSRDGSTQHYWRLHTHFAIGRANQGRNDATWANVGDPLASSHELSARPTIPDHC